MKNKWLKINCIILTMIISQIIIFLDLKNLGNASSGGGFFEYGFGIKFSIFIYLIVLLLFLLRIKRNKTKDINIISTILSSIITAVIIYFLNLYLFENIIGRNNYDMYKYQYIICTLVIIGISGLFGFLKLIGKVHNK